MRKRDVPMKSAGLGVHYSLKEKDQSIVKTMEVLSEYQGLSLKSKL